MKLKNKHRVVTDKYAGYEVQIKRWWFPFWIKKGGDFLGLYTFISIQEAKEFIDRGCKVKEKEIIYHTPEKSIKEKRNDKIKKLL